MEKQILTFCFFSLSLCTLTSLVHPNPKFVEFEDSFAPAPHLFHPFGEVFKIYYNNYKAHYKLENYYTIPKIIHFIWLGSPLPKKAEKIIATWKDHHPHWEIKIWDDDSLSSFPLKNQKAFDTAQNFGEKSDILRYEILYRFGGVYADTDVECLQSFDFLHRSCEFYAGVLHGNHALLNAIIGVREKHPIMEACIDLLLLGNGDHDEQRILRATGPYHLTQVFLYCAPMCDSTKLAILPPSFFYPFPAKCALEDKIGEIEARTLFVKPESLTIHYWEGSWTKN